MTGPQTTGMHEACWVDLYHSKTPRSAPTHVDIFSNRLVGVLSSAMLVLMLVLLLVVEPLVLVVLGETMLVWALVLVCGAGVGGVGAGGPW